MKCGVSVWTGSCGSG